MPTAKSRFFLAYFLVMSGRPG